MGFTVVHAHHFMSPGSQVRSAPAYLLLGHEMSAVDRAMPGPPECSALIRVGNIAEV